jgi:2-hydroxychromene-2-carboxylate isomerase
VIGVEQKMSSILTPAITKFFTSETLISVERHWSWLIGDLNQIEFYHDPCNPHSHLTLFALLELQSRLKDESLQLIIKPVKEQPGSYQTSNSLSEWQWSLQDAIIAAKPYSDLIPHTSNFMQHFNKEFSQEKKNKALACAISIVQQHHQPNNCLIKLCELGTAIFKQLDDDFETIFPSQLDITPLQYNEALNYILLNEKDLKRNHYLVAMIRRGRAWYWGIDRLYYLEVELNIIPPKYCLNHHHNINNILSIPIICSNNNNKRQLKLQFFYSFRSPYSQIVLKPLKECLHRVHVARTNLQVEIEVMAVLPAVMRGLEIPSTKRLYIIRDAAREARLTGQDEFFKVIDPVGKPVERAFVAYWFAHQQGKAFEFLESWSKLVWADGVDVRNDIGLKAVVDNVNGLSWTEIYEKGFNNEIIDTKWRDMAENNRKLLYEIGLWGVPSFRILDGTKQIGTAVWGQDRLFEIENILMRENL